MSIADKLQTILENEQKVFDAGKKAENERFWDIYHEDLLEKIKCRNCESIAVCCQWSYTHLMSVFRYRYMRF